MNNSVYTAAINYVSLFQKANIKAVWSITDKSRFAVLHNTWRFGGAPVGRHLVSFGSINCKPVNRNSKIFQSFCLKVDYVYLLTIQLKLEIVPTREITTKIKRRLSFSLRWPWAYFLNGPNAAASAAPTLIRHWSCASLLNDRLCSVLCCRSFCARRFTSRTWLPSARLVSCLNSTNSSGDEIANVNFLTTISHTRRPTSKYWKRDKPTSFNKLDDR